MPRTILVFLGLLLVIAQAHAQQLERAKTTNFQIPSDVVSSGGGDGAKSTNYILDDTIGEANIGFGRSNNYDLNAGYRQPDGGTFLSLTCDDVTNLGTITLTGRATADNTCTVITDSDAGYSLSWSVRSGSGGTNTGHLISTTAPHTSTIPPFDASLSGLTGYWKLDETSAGSTVRDVSGNGLQGTAQGAAGTQNLPQPSTNLPTATNTSNVRSRTFDGTDDAVRVGDATPLDVAQLSLSVWFNVDALDGTRKFLAGKWANGQRSYQLQITAANTLDGIISNTGGNDANSTVSTSAAGLAGSWNHAVVTFDGTTLRLYLNGVEVDSEVPGYSSVFSGTANFGIGTVFFNAPTTALDPWKGKLDEVRLYNKALTAAEVEALAAVPHTWSVAAHKSYWGGRLRSSSTDIHSKWGTDSSSEKWLNIGDGSYPVVTRSTRTSVSGSTEVFQYRAEVGATAIVPNGLYETTVTLTAASL